MYDTMEELKKEFIKKKWEVQADVVAKYRGVFDYKIPLIVKQKQLEYKIFFIPMSADSDVRDAIVSMAGHYKNKEILILAILHPNVAKHIKSWALNRVALTPKHLWEIIHNDVKLHKYQKEIADLRENIDKIHKKITKLEETVAGRF